jgi:hypothetical protein
MAKDIFANRKIYFCKWQKIFLQMTEEAKIRGFYFPLKKLFNNFGGKWAISRHTHLVTLVPNFL